jgi:hypothetical protein
MTSFCNYKTGARGCAKYEGKKGKKFKEIVSFLYFNFSLQFTTIGRFSSLFLSLSFDKNV